MEFWEKILRFLLIWFAIFIILDIVAIAAYWDEFAAAVSGSISGLLGSLASPLIAIVILVWIIRSVFHR